MNVFLMLMALFSAEGTPEWLVQGAFHRHAKALKTEAWSLRDPDAVRRYTELITEYYSSQVAFKVFFLRDLREGEHLAVLRKRESVAPYDSESMVEDKLEVLLKRADEAFPGHLAVRFAKAQFLFRGRCCLLVKPFEMNPAEILAVFEEGRQAGMESAGSLLALSLQAIEQSRVDRARTVTWLKRAFDLNRDDGEVGLALANAWLELERFKEAAALARDLFSRAINPTQKLDALTVAARAFSGLKLPLEVMRSVEAGLNINPRHPFLWMIGMDQLRSQDDGAIYADLAARFILADRLNPKGFQLYLDYLGLRGVHTHDDVWMKRYEDDRRTDHLEEATRLFNLGRFALFRKDAEKARRFFKKARKEAKKVTDPPEGLFEAIDKLQAEAKSVKP